MPLYEHVFLARQDASTQQVEDLTTQMTGIVEGLGGTITVSSRAGQGTDIVIDLPIAHTEVAA